MKRSIMLSVVLATVAGAATTSTWELGGYQEFLKGRMSGLSLTREGRLTLGPKLETVYASDQAQIWSLAQAADGSTYLGTGNRGRLFKVDAAGNGSAVWSAEESSIFAVAVDRAGVVYAGTSPDGKVYRIQNGRATEYFNPGERYIWALALAPDGALYVATGQQGKIYKVTAAGRGEVYYETGQAHVTALAFDAQGRLLAGSEPNGILYRVTGAPARGFVLYDSSLPEIRTILPMPDGTIYAAALGGSIARRTAAAATSTTSATPLVTAPGTSITVTDAQAGLVAAPKPEPAKTAASSANISAPAAVTEVSGVEHAALYKILPDNTVETLWSSKEENLYDIAAETGGTLALLTDVQGRVYRLDPRADRTHEAMLIAQTNETDAARLAISPRGLLVAAGNTGRLLRLDAAAGASGWFESPVHDAGTVARWGRLTWVGGSGVSYKTRSGNSVRPDATWSDWSDAITDPAKAVIGSPNARYIQWRAELNGAGAELESATIAFLPQNTPPVIRSISVSAQASSTPKNASAGTSSTFSVTVTDSPDASTAAGTAAQMIARPSGQQIYITWQADDPEGDRLSYSLFFRGDGERVATPAPHSLGGLWRRGNGTGVKLH